MKEIIDLRSDVMTLPTDEMLDAMRSARVGDERSGSDPSVLELEALAARMLGKEAGLFCVSGTMANTVALMSHAGAGDSIVAGQWSHVAVWESKSVVLAGISTVTLPDRAGFIEPDMIKDVLQSGRAARPVAVCLENTHNIAGGTVLDKSAIDLYSGLARRHGAALHVDGARIFNAAIALKTTAKELVKNADSVMFCLSKGLCCPIGSMVVGRKQFIDRARKKKVILGGGLRQAGYMAAAGIVALRTTVNRLAEDHRKNRAICKKVLSEIPELKLTPDEFPTNIFIFSLKSLKTTAEIFYAEMAKHGVLVDAVGALARTVTHRCVSAEQCDRAADVMVRVMKDILSKKRGR